MLVDGGNKFSFEKKFGRGCVNLLPREDASLQDAAHDTFDWNCALDSSYVTCYLCHECHERY